jgi:hypothetical protein
MRKKISFFFLMISFCSLFAQKDSLVDLSFNKKLMNQLEQQAAAERRQNSNAKKQALTLPFIDDFSQHYFYPDENKWVDYNVYINSSYPVNPISYGVATFDGLDSTGYPYNFLNPTSYGIADYLTSRVIDLTTVTDSVYLSFYYQAQGIGNLPEAKDSLRLEFFRKSDSTWVRQWATSGKALAPFELVMIPVDTSFQNDTFQFRFKNYATLSGNVDHWHLDYVYLNDSRTYADTTLNDVALTGNFYNMLNETTAMPWSHYIVDSLTNMRTAIDVEYRNNHNSNYAVFYKYQVIEDNGAGAVIETYPSTTSSKNVNGHSSLIEPQAVYDLPLNNFYFPTDDTASTKIFQIKNYFDLNSVIDFNQQNDTAITYQVFNNYYAYDDGSAEAGYGIEGIGAKLANQFVIKKSDTLTSIKIYFNPVTYNHSDKSFKLTIWSSINPEVELYQQTDFYNPVYSFTNEFLYYDLAFPIYLPAGTYYFGYENITQDFLTIGYDLNTNTQNRIFFNAEGVWENSNYAGSLMIQPVFKYDEAVVGVNELSNEESSVKIYPNPSNGLFFFNKTRNIEATVYDLLGSKVMSFPKNNYSTLNLTSLSNGVYFIHLSDNNKTQVEKIIISK